MPNSGRPIKFTGAELGDLRHVCALVEDVSSGADLVVPFIIDGLDAGVRIVLAVAGETGTTLRDRLAAAGIDLANLTSSGQLHVGSLPDDPRGRSFDPSARVAALRGLLDEGGPRDDRQTRLIVDMDWALDGVTFHALLASEASLDQLLGSGGDIAVCVYDLSRHSARTIADVLGVHPAALVGGVLRTLPVPARAPARERLLAAASRLFHQTGIHATGVDAVIAEAGVAKATFYRHFPSKDDLVVAWLRDPRAWWLDRVRADVEANSSGGADAIPVFYEALARWLEAENYRGCPFLNTSVEITDAGHPARIAVVELLQAVEDFLTDLVAAAGYRNPRVIAARLQALAAGSISLSVARGNSDAALAARDAALGILAEAERD